MSEHITEVITPKTVKSDAGTGTVKRVSGPNGRIASSLMVLCLVSLTIVIMVMAAVPPVSRDALTHHLAVPKLWVAHGGMVELSDLVFSYYPMNLDLLYVIPMLFGNDIIPKYIHFFFALATAWLIYAYLRPRTTGPLSLLGVLLFLSMPVIVKLSISVYVDLGLVFFSWASLLQLSKWARCPHSSRHLVFSAVLCGMGLGTKYNGLIVFFLLTCFVAVIYTRCIARDRYDGRLAIGFPILFFFAALVVFSPWMVKNYRLTGNPIYPLYNDRITGDVDRAEISNMSMKPWLQRKLIYGESAAETALIPLRVFFQGKDDDPRLFDGRLNPALLLCPLLLLVSRKKKPAPNLRREQFLFASFSILFLLYASFMVDMRIRYIAPVIPPLVVLAVLGIHHGLQCVDRVGHLKIRLVGRWVVAGGLFFFMVMNAAYLISVFRSVDPLPYLAGKTSRESYLKNKLPDYAAVQFANHLQQDRIKILALFLGNRLYYFDRPVNFGNHLFESMVIGATKEMTISSQLRNAGYTHCIVGIGLFESWINRVFDAEQKEHLSQWLKNDCIQLFSESGYVVLQLVPNDVIDSPLYQKGNA